jgi:uncharacterized RDD family membrane protein YckC
LIERFSPVALQPPAAGLSRRIGSLCYELPLIVAISFVAGWIFLPVTDCLGSPFARPLLQLFLVAVAAVYFIYCWTHGGQTLPMKTWRLRLVARDGGPVSLKLAVRRYLIALPAVALCGFGFAWALIDRERQFLHDRIAGTSIVRSGMIAGDSAGRAVTR